MFNAFVWGVSWWLFRALETQGLHPLWSTALVYAFALLALLLVRRGAWRGFAQYPLLWLLLAASGLTNVGFNWAVTVGDVVRVVLLFYLMPAWSVLLAWPLLGEKPAPASLLRLVLALAGVVVVLKPAGAGWPVPEGLPDWLALMGGFCFALTNILLLKLNRVPSEARVLAMFSGGAVMAASAATLGLAQGFVPEMSRPNAVLLGLGLALSLSFLVGNLALQYGAARLAAHTTALVMLSEVIFASVSSVVLGAATLETRTLAGGALILLAAAWSAGPTRARAQASPSTAPETTR